MSGRNGALKYNHVILSTFCLAIANGEVSRNSSDSPTSCSFQESNSPVEDTSDKKEPDVPTDVTCEAVTGVDCPEPTSVESASTPREAAMDVNLGTAGDGQGQNGLEHSDSYHGKDADFTGDSSNLGASEDDLPSPDSDIEVVCEKTVVPSTSRGVSLSFSADDLLDRWAKDYLNLSGSNSSAGLDEGIVASVVRHIVKGCAIITFW